MTTFLKFEMTMGIALMLALMLLQSNKLFAQSSKSKQQILVDVSHGQKFYHNPNDMPGKDSAFVERIKYMTGELQKNAASLKAEVTYLKTSITPDALKKCNLLFIHMPSSKYSEAEIEAIQQYIKKGGSLFLVMEVDFWSTLDQANVNDILSPFNIVFKSDNPDKKSSGGHTKASLVTNKQFTIPYHGARIVEGGTPFCFSNQTQDHPFGVYKQVDNGGKIIAMGDGMVSLYMTKWEDVDNYQCSLFMQDAIAWLLKK